MPASRAARGAQASRRRRPSAAPVPAARGPSHAGRRSQGAREAGRRVAEAPADDGAVLARTTGPKRGLGGEQVEGRQAVRELLLAGRRRVTRDLARSPRPGAGPVLEDIVDAGPGRAGAGARGQPLEALRRRPGPRRPQGVLALAAELPEAELDDLVAEPARAGPPRSCSRSTASPTPATSGALLRSAECAGVTGVVLPRHRAVHITPTVTKAAAGAVEHLPWRWSAACPRRSRELRNAGVWVVGLDGDGDGELWSMPAADGPIAPRARRRGQGFRGSCASGATRWCASRCSAHWPRSTSRRRPRWPASRWHAPESEQEFLLPVLPVCGSACGRSPCGRPATGTRALTPSDAHGSTGLAPLGHLDLLRSSTPRAVTIAPARPNRPGRAGQTHRCGSRRSRAGGRRHRPSTP